MAFWGPSLHFNPKRQRTSNLWAQQRRNHRRQLFHSQHIVKVSKDSDPSALHAHSLSLSEYWRLIPKVVHVPAETESIAIVSIVKGVTAFLFDGEVYLEVQRQLRKEIKVMQLALDVVCNDWINDKLDTINPTAYTDFIHDHLQLKQQELTQLVAEFLEISNFLNV